MQTIKLPEFTLRESDILHLLARTYSRKQIAEKLHISYSTVDSHLYSIFKKTGLHNLVELSHYAQDRGYGIQSPRITEALAPLPVTTQNSETL
jgi:DNA-binding NarL/FixJ family response regulator